MPRLRPWARVRSRETVAVGLAERSGVFQSEARQLAQELGARTIEDRQGGEVDA